MFTRFVGLAVVLAIMIGCTPSPDKLDTVPVTGTVTLDKAPLAGAFVTFNPPQGSQLKPANGTTDDQGEFTLSTFVSGANTAQGALPGTYTVTITKTEEPQGEQSAMNPADMAAGGASQKEMQERMDAQAKLMEDQRSGENAGGENKNLMEGMEAKSLIPDRYSNVDSSPFENIVVKDGSNDPFTFELTSN